jgi:hypothetical protein
MTTYVDLIQATHQFIATCIDWVDKTGLPSIALTLPIFEWSGGAACIQ